MGSILVRYQLDLIDGSFAHNDQLYGNFQHQLIIIDHRRYFTARFLLFDKADLFQIL